MRLRVAAIVLGAAAKLRAMNVTKQLEGFKKGKKYYRKCPMQISYMLRGKARVHKTEMFSLHHQTQLDMMNRQYLSIFWSCSVLDRPPLPTLLRVAAGKLRRKFSQT